MGVCRALSALSVAVALGVAGTASAASDHEHQSGGFKYGPQGQVFGSPPLSTPRHVYGLATPEPRRMRGNTGQRATHDTAGHAAAVLDSLMQPYKDPNWDHRYQSWCDVDPNCNGWNKKIQEYEVLEQGSPHL